jgi:hypothetical protein
LLTKTVTTTQLILAKRTPRATTASSIAAAATAAQTMASGTSAAQQSAEKAQQLLRPGVGPKIEGGYFGTIYENRHRRNAPLNYRDGSSSSDGGSNAPWQTQHRRDERRNRQSINSAFTAATAPAAKEAAAPKEAGAPAAKETGTPADKESGTPKEMDAPAAKEGGEPAESALTAETTSEEEIPQQRHYSTAAAKKRNFLIHAYYNIDAGTPFESEREFQDLIKSPLAEAIYACAKASGI